MTGVQTCALLIWIATIDFDYEKEIKTEAERLENPLGFQVISYRVDVENVEVK